MNNTEKEKIKILNQITKIIDDKATSYKSRMKEMPTAQFYSEKKLILDMIDDAIKLAGELKNIPQTKDMIDDFKKLTKQISDIRPLK